MSPVPLILRDGGMVTLDPEDLVLTVARTDTPPAHLPWTIEASAWPAGQKWELGCFSTRGEADWHRRAIARHGIDPLGRSWR